MLKTFQFRVSRRGSGGRLRLLAIPENNQINAINEMWTNI
jgi:hypothetical protein